MNLFKRIKNILELSKYEPVNNPELLDGITLEKNVESKPQKAQIIKRNRDEVGNFIKEK